MERLMIQKTNPSWANKFSILQFPSINGNWKIGQHSASTSVAPKECKLYCETRHLTHCSKVDTNPNVICQYWIESPLDLRAHSSTHESWNFRSWGPDWGHVQTPMNSWIKWFANSRLAMLLNSFGSNEMGPFKNCEGVHSSYNAWLNKN